MSTPLLAPVAESYNNIDPQVYADLKDKYDVLYQQLSTMELEKKELMREIKKIRETNEELTELEAQEHDEIEQFKTFTKPLLAGSLASMSAALGDADILQESISIQNHDLKDLGDKLQEENIKFREQNKQYQLKIENMQINEQKKENEYKHKIQLLETEIENLNTEENDVITKYAQLADDYSVLKKETVKQLQSQMEVASPVPDDHGISDDQLVQIADNTSVHISSKFIRSSQNILTYGNNTSPNVSKRNMLQFVQYDSVPELTNYGSDGSSEYISATDSIEDRAQVIHVDIASPMAKIDENNTIDKQEAKFNYDVNDKNNKEKEMGNIIKNMENDIKGKDNMIQQKNIMIKSDKIKIADKNNEIKKLKKQISKLQKQNRDLFEKNDQDNENQCFAIKWFK